MAATRDATTRPLRIAIASGKGGTGKTTIATGLAHSLASGQDPYPILPPLHFIDCDVETPNAHLFLGVSFNRREDVAIQIPLVDATRCSGCGRCAEVCQYHAIAVLGKRTLVFPALCHGCGSCMLECPEHAITETPHNIGVLEAGPAARGIQFARGLLAVGEPMAAPVIRRLKQSVFGGALQDARIVILDAPPGASCPVVESVRGADYLLLVTEPTPFGLHDLRLAINVAAELGIPAGIIINRDGIGDTAVDEFCAAQGLHILLRIPYERDIAAGIAQGHTLLEIHPEYAARFRALYDEIVRQVRGATCNSSSF